jgi:excinuclease UvrABC nuclease subunit
MKKFEFRLRSVRVLRQRLMNEAELRYGEAVTRRRGVEDLIRGSIARMETINNQATTHLDRIGFARDQEATIARLKVEEGKLIGLRSRLKQAFQQEEKAKKDFLWPGEIMTCL